MINLYHGDCMEAMANMKDNEYDLAIVDPPYGIKIDKIPQFKGGKRTGTKRNYKKGNWDNNIPNDTYFKELFRVSKDQIIWGGNYFSKFLPKSMGWIVWDKGQRIANSDGELAFTSFDRALRIFEMNRVELLIEGTIHPTQKPIKLYKWLLTNYAKPGDKILDTHCGSGSIMIACHDLNFDLTAYEIDKDYYEAAMKRFNNHISQLDLFR